MKNSLKNQFLIAMPNLTDSFFYRSVIYLYEHDEEGAAGIIINRPTKVMLEELLSHLNIANTAENIKNTPVLFGGPVQKNQGLVLHNQTDSNWKSSTQLDDNIILTSSTDILEVLGTEEGPSDALVTLGYAGWEAEQLEQELTDNTWLTVAATDELLFKTPTKQRWTAASSLLGIDINLISPNAGHA